MPTYLSPGVYIDEKPAGSAPIEGVGTAVAGFVGLAAGGPFNEPTLVSNWKQFVDTFGDFTGEGFLAHAVYGYFLNGGGNCYVVRIGANGAPAAAEGTLAAVPAEDREDGTPRYVIRALDPGPEGNRITVDVADASDGGDAFKLVVRRDGKVEEEHDNLPFGRGRQSATTALKTKSQLIELVEAPQAPLARPTNTTISLVGGTTAAPAKIEPTDYVGDVADRTGFAGLEAIENVTMLAVPDAVAAHQRGAISKEDLKAVQLAMIAHCELMGDRVAIIDAPIGLNAQAILDWRQNFAGYDSKYAAMYWPEIRVFDPATNTNIFVPPSGHMAGIWGRNDDTRGVHKAPANEVVRGAISVGCAITAREQELLNPVGINCIRPFVGRGIRVWGARTISSEGEWRYLNIRRLFNYLEKSIMNGTQWVPFEPNDDALWARVRRTISAFLTNEWRKGALFGLTPDEAFYVKCDRETNPPELVDVGQLNCEIGVAPVKPAEFVIFHLSQFSGGAAIAE